jgi:hypothetical protein
VQPLERLWLGDDVSLARSGRVKYFEEGRPDISQEKG